MRSCLSLIGFLTVAAVVLVGGWLFRDEIGVVLSALRSRSEPSVEAAAATGPELARQAEAKIMALGRGEIEEAALTPEELNGWVRHGLEGFFPDFVADVSASVDEYDRLVLAGRVVVSDVPGAERVGALGSLFGDTTDVSLRGRLDGLEAGRGVLYVDRLQIGLLVLPELIRGQVIDQLAGEPDDDLPSIAVTLELAPFLSEIGLRGGQIVLERS